MEKQQAVDFVLVGLQNNLSQAEITQSLSQALKAPPEVVEKFVAQIASTYQPAPAPVPTPEPVIFAPADDDVTGYTPDPYLSTEPAWTEADYPSSYLDDLDELAGATGDAIAIQASPDPVDGAAEAAAVAAVSAAPAAIPGVNEPIPGDQQELEQLILKALAKDRKESDIIMAVCERTGMSWHEAQRLVSRVQAENRKKLGSKQAWIILPICIVIILAGLGLVGASVNEFYSLSTAMIESNANPIMAVSGTSSAIRILPYLIIGLGLVLGGGIGLWRSLAQINS